MNMLEHPAITNCERTGYPKHYKPILCDRCKGVIQTGEYYGECDGRNICEECIEDEWKELSTKEKVIYLGYDSKFNG